MVIDTSSDRRFARSSTPYSTRSPGSIRQNQASPAPNTLPKIPSSPAKFPWRWSASCRAKSARRTELFRAAIGWSLHPPKVTPCVPATRRNWPARSSAKHRNRCRRGENRSSGDAALDCGALSRDTCQHYRVNSSATRDYLAGGAVANFAGSKVAGSSFVPVLISVYSSVKVNLSLL
jgi:hypothetical protein